MPVGGEEPWGHRQQVLAPVRQVVALCVQAILSTEASRPWKRSWEELGRVSGLPSRTLGVREGFQVQQVDWGRAAVVWTLPV